MYTHIYIHRYIERDNIVKLLLLYLYIHTSSAAQGGGGSVKNRKPIGEISFCESRMAEQIH